MATTSASAISAPNSPPKSRARLILIILLALGTAAGAAGAGYYYFYMRDSAHTTAAAVKPPKDPIFVALEPFTVNLQPNGRSRFLHAVVTVKVDSTQSQAQLVQYLPEVRSRVLATLANRAAESLLTTPEKDALATEIMVALKQPFGVNLPPAEISRVMFTTFMLQ